MPTCTLGGFIYPASLVHYVYDAAGSSRSSTVCSGWIRALDAPITRPSTPPPHTTDGIGCTPVAPGGKRTSPPQSVPDDAVAFVVRVDFGSPTDSATLKVYDNDAKIAEGSLNACGTAIWVFQVMR